MDISSIGILLLPPFCFVLLILLTLIVDGLTQYYEYCHNQVNCGRFKFLGWQLCGTFLQLISFPFVLTMMVLEVVLNLFLYTMETSSKILSVGCNDRFSLVILAILLSGTVYWKYKQALEAPVV